LPVVVPGDEDEVLNVGGGVVDVVASGLAEDDTLVLGVVLGLGEAGDVTAAGGVDAVCVGVGLGQLEVGVGPGDGFWLAAAELGPLLGLCVVVTLGVAVALTLELPVTLGLTMAEGLTPGLAASLLALPEGAVVGVVTVVPADVGLPDEVARAGVADECAEADAEQVALGLK
jgi:hypothetical protein